MFKTNKDVASNINTRREQITDNNIKEKEISKRNIEANLRWNYFVVFFIRLESDIKDFFFFYNETKSSSNYHNYF